MDSTGRSLAVFTGRGAVDILNISNPLFSSVLSVTVAPAAKTVSPLGGLNKCLINYNLKGGINID